MNAAIRHARCPRLATSLLVSLSIVTLNFGCAATSHAGPLQASFDNTKPDAVIELWEQHWTLNDDGSTVFHEKKHVRLNSDRTYDAFCDPRITYNVANDKLDVLVARTKRPDGTYREATDYAHVEVSPGASAGWPAFADVRQHLIVMPGVEPGCVLELEYRITSKAGTRSPPAADVRLDDQYPIGKRIVSITAPEDVAVSFAAIHCSPTGARDKNGNAETIRWTVKDLPAQPREPQSPPWQAKAPRLAFSTAGESTAWFKNLLCSLDASVDDDKLIEKLAVEWTADADSDSEKLRAIQESLEETFNFVAFPVDWRPALPRPASTVMQSGYGLPREAACLYLALVRAAGVKIQSGIIAADHVFLHEAPQLGMIAAYVLVLATDDGLEFWNAQRGRIIRDTRWAGHNALWFDGDELRHHALPPFANADKSRCHIVGDIELDGDGKFAGEVEIAVSGLFVSPERLRTSSQQKSKINSIVRNALPGATVKDFTVTALSDDELRVTAKIKSSDACDKLGEAYQLKLAGGGAAASVVSIPLAAAERRTPAWLAGAFDEHIKLTITWPEKWTVDALPSQVEKLTGDWGKLVQTVSLDESKLTVDRQFHIAKRMLAPADVLTLRGPLNKLRSPHAHTLLLRP